MLPKLPWFRGKNGIKETEFYQRIKPNLNNLGALTYTSLGVYIAQDQISLIKIAFARFSYRGLSYERIAWCTRRQIQVYG